MFLLPRAAWLFTGCLPAVHLCPPAHLLEPVPRSSLRSCELRPPLRVCSEHGSGADLPPSHRMVPKPQGQDHRLHSGQHYYLDLTFIREGWRLTPKTKRMALVFYFLVPTTWFSSQRGKLTNNNLFYPGWVWSKLHGFGSNTHLCGIQGKHM